MRLTDVWFKCSPIPDVPAPASSYLYISTVICKMPDHVESKEPYGENDLTSPQDVLPLDGITRLGRTALSHAFECRKHRIDHYE